MTVCAQRLPEDPTAGTVAATAAVAAMEAPFWLLNDATRNLFCNLQWQVLEEANDGGAPMLLCMLSYLAKMSPKERQGVMEMLAMSTGSQPPLSPPQARPQPTPMKAPMPMPTSPMPTSPNPPPTSAAGAGLARRGAAAAHGRMPQPPVSPPPVSSPPGLRSPTGSLPMASPPSTPTCGANIAQTLGHLAAFSPETQATIGRAGAAETLTKLVRDGSPHLRAEAVRALLALVHGSAENLKALVCAGGAPALVDAIADDDLPMETREQGAKLVSLLSKSHGATVAVAGGIEAMTTLLQEGSYVACGFAVFALRYLALGVGDAKVTIARAGALPPMLRLLRDGVPDELRGYAAGLLTTLADGCDEGRRAIFSMGGVAALARLVTTSGVGIDVVRRATAALARLAAGGEQESVAIVRAGVAPALVRLLSTREAQLEATETLAALASRPGECQAAVLQVGGAAALLHMAQAGHPMPRARATAALQHLAEGGPEGRATIAELLGGLGAASPGGSPHSPVAAAIAGMAALSREVAAKASSAARPSLVPLASIDESPLEA